VGYTVGVLGLGAGAVLLLTKDDADGTALSVGPTGARVEHHF
jgi:hypothetical protein